MHFAHRNKKTTNKARDQGSRGSHGIVNGELNISQQLLQNQFSGVNTGGVLHFLDPFLRNINETDANKNCAVNTHKFLCWLEGI